MIHREQMHRGLQSVERVGKDGAVRFRSVLIDFKTFILRGNIFELAVGVVIGAAFTLIVQSLVADMFTPVISLIGTGNVLQEKFIILRNGRGENATYGTRLEAKDDGAITMNIGNFIQTIINFFMVGFCLYLFMGVVHIFKKKANSTDFQCPKCCETVKEKAVRCPHCAIKLIQSELEEEPRSMVEESTAQLQNNPIDEPLQSGLKKPGSSGLFKRRSTLPPIPEKNSVVELAISSNLRRNIVHPQTNNEDNNNLYEKVL